MNKKHLFFNLNIIIAGLIALAIAAQTGLYFDNKFHQNELTSLVSTITHFVIYLLLNSVFHYFTNKNQYKGIDKNLFIDLGKIYGTQIPVFGVYYGVYFGVNDLLLHSMSTVVISNISAWFVGTLIIHTYLAHKAGVFDE